MTQWSRDCVQPVNQHLAAAQLEKPAGGSQIAPPEIMLSSWAVVGRAIVFYLKCALKCFKKKKNKIKKRTAFRLGFVYLLWLRTTGSWAHSQQLKVAWSMLAWLTSFAWLTLVQAHLYVWTRVPIVSALPSFMSKCVLLRGRRTSSIAPPLQLKVNLALTDSFHTWCSPRRLQQR